MENILSIIKGVHPGLIIGRELKKRGIGKSKFAISLQEYPQTFSAITLGKRDLNTALALKIEKALGMEEGYLMILQTYHDINKIKEKEEMKFQPDLTKIRRVLFWDTKMENINWIRHKYTVVRRVFERGNEEEKNEMIRFYGKEEVDKILNDPKLDPLTRT
jgi:plasmid maintenance system antidote protein VapI